jgi:hypothetical protein
MSESSFEWPILNSPYAYPTRHRELDADGQLTNHIVESRPFGVDHVGAAAADYPIYRL